MTTDVGLFALNSGEVSRLGLARVDLAKLRIAAEKQENFLPHILGPTMLRPGLQFIAQMPGDAPGWLGEFYYSETEKALLVMTASELRFLVNDVFLTRPLVTATVPNGNFASGLSGWTDSDEAGAVSSASLNALVLQGTGTNYAWIDRQITVVQPNVEHALRLTVTSGYVALLVGTALGGSTYVEEYNLLPGYHSIALTPTGNFWIRLGSSTKYPSLVGSISIESNGIVSLPSPYVSKADFDAIRYDQSADVIFMACAGFVQHRVERRSVDSRSWSIVTYQSDDGPFRNPNGLPTQIESSATTGSVTLTSDRPFFKVGMVGSILKLTHSSQAVSSVLAGSNQFTNPIRVSGLASHNDSLSSRGFALDVSGTYSGSVRLQRSLALPGAWQDVEAYNVPVSKTFDDGLDNQIIFYRLGFKTGEYTSGSANASLSYAGSSQTGIVRIAGVTDSTHAVGSVLTDIGAAATFTDDWAEGEWSALRGWPAAVAIFDGRLGWFQSIKAQLSVSDGFSSFDDTIDGDKAPINRIVTTGGKDSIRWALALQRLIVGTAAQIVSVRASSFDEPLTASAFTAKPCAEDGAASGVRAIRNGTHGIFVSAANRLFKLVYDVQSNDYESLPIDRLKPEMFSVGVADIAIQTRPDNANIWVPLNDGSCVFVASNKGDDVEAMVSVTTQGLFERTARLLGKGDDSVYFIVQRLVNGVTKRFIEKLAKRSECQGGLLNKSGVDAHVVYSGVPVTVVTGLSHLEGAAVVVWADGAQALGVYTVLGGSITLPVAASNVVVGIPVTGRIKTAKLAYAAERGTALTLMKRVSRVGLVMADVVPGAVRIGRDFTNMTGLSQTYRGRPLNSGEVMAEYDDVPSSFNGGWTPDSRVCIEVSGPNPCTILALAIHMETNEPIEPAPAPSNRG